MRFGYGQAERVAAWYAESYVTLDRQQSRMLGQQLADFKQWHCSTQLGGYAAWLRQVGDEIQPGVDAVASRSGSATSSISPRRRPTRLRRDWRRSVAR